MLFRFHRRLLEDSMKTCVSLRNYKSLLAEYISTLDIFGDDRKITKEMLEITHYGFDKRIDWNSYIVVIKDFGVIGFTNSEVLDEEFKWHYGPTKTDSNPGSMWHHDCGGEVYCFEEGYVCSKCNMGCDNDEEDLEAIILKKDLDNDDIIQKEKTHYEKLKELFIEFGLEFDEKEKNEVGGGDVPTNKSIYCEQGIHQNVMGYTGFSSEFVFDKDGNFIQLNCWE